MKIWDSIKEFFRTIKKSIEDYQVRSANREEAEIERLKRKEKLLKQKAKTKKAEEELSKYNKSMFGRSESFNFVSNNENSDDVIGLNKVLGKDGKAR